MTFESATGSAEPDLATLDETQKKQYLFARQKETLDDFLARGAISKQQYEKSFGDLKRKMGFSD